MKTFLRVAGAECRKAFCSKAFLLGTALLLLFSVLSAVYMIEVRASYNPGQVLANQVDSLPHPGILIRIVLFPAGAAWRRIKSIGVGIDTNILKLALYQPCYNFPDLPVFLCQENVRTKLRR